MRPLISLDVFDTAIFRKVFYPTDIFALVEDEVGKDFKNKRIQAQERARLKNPSYTLLDIYKELPLFSPKEEIKAELINCEANPYILNMYKTFDCDFVFISDMYLPSSVIKAMLERCGYENPKVFVSCEYKAGKGNGVLFRKVESALNRKINKHIGDNYVADIEGAKKAGIKEFEYIGPPIYNREVVTPNLRNLNLRKILIDEELSNDLIEEKIGFQFAPVVLAFTQKVLDEAKEGQTIFFNARDGFLMYLVAKYVLKTKKRIKYCRFSRKSCLFADIMTNLPITHPQNRIALHLLKISRISSLRDFLRTYNFNENRDFSPFLKEYGINLDSDINFHPNKLGIIERLIVFIEKELYEKANRERKNFSLYVKNIGMKNGDIFVDLGYLGTLQGVIKRILGKDLKGRYIFVNDGSVGNYYGNRYERLSFFPINYLRNYGGAAVEVIFSEPKGTVMGYNEKGLPVVAPDNNIRRRFSKGIVRGVLKGCRKLCKESIKISTQDCATIVKRYLDNPTFEEASFGNNLIFENGSLENESITWFNEEWIKRGELKGCFNRSYWKSAFRVLLNNHPLYKSLRGVI